MCQKQPGEVHENEMGSEGIDPGEHKEESAEIRHNLPVPSYIWSEVQESLSDGREGQTVCKGDGPKEQAAVSEWPLTEDSERGAQHDRQKKIFFRFFPEASGIFWGLR